MEEGLSMVHKCKARSAQAALRREQDLRDALLTVRARRDRNRERRLALYEERASRGLPLFSK
jgi:hypothetical protein